MFISRLLAPTLREIPAEAVAVSHKLMLKAGLMRKISSGLYAYLPVGYRTLKKIGQVVREEMERTGAQEISIPALLPAEPFRQSGRWEHFSPEIHKFRDRSGRELCLGATGEEIFADIVKHSTRSYRSFPLLLYHVQNIYSDEKKPGNGIIKCREYLVMEACSFDRDEQGLGESLGKMHEAYRRIFERCGLEVVEAESKSPDGCDSSVFLVRSDIGETVFAHCKACGYAAGLDAVSAAACGAADGGNADFSEMLPIEKVETPDARTIEDLTYFFGCSPDRFAKTLIYRSGDRIIAAMVRGDRELNEAKLRAAAQCGELEMADGETVRKATGADIGFAGPVRINAELYIDMEVARSVNLITGANETGYHLVNVNINRDFRGTVADLRNVVEGDPCCRCKSPLKIERGIEVARINRLGTRYTDAAGCMYIDENGSEKPVVMGSYIIDIGRIMAAIIEYSHDDYGIIWPVSVAPYQAVIVPVSVDPVPFGLAQELYEKLKEAGVETLLDDRDERAGVKFNDADLLGIPVRITIGRKAVDRIVEMKLRNSKEKREMSAEEAVDTAVEILKPGD